LAIPAVQRKKKKKILRLHEKGVISSSAPLINDGGTYGSSPRKGKQSNKITLSVRRKQEERTGAPKLLKGEGKKHSPLP